MSVDADDVRKVSRLAKLRLSDDEMTKMTRELAELLEYFNRIENVDTSDVSPMFNPVDGHDIWREDRAFDAEITSEVLQEAPKTADGFFVVPQTVAGAEEEENE